MTNALLKLTTSQDLSFVNWNSLKGKENNFILSGHINKGGSHKGFVIVQSTNGMFRLYATDSLEYLDKINNSLESINDNQIKAGAK